MPNTLPAYHQIPPQKKELKDSSYCPAHEGLIIALTKRALNHVKNEFYEIYPTLVFFEVFRLARKDKFND